MDIREEAIQDKSQDTEFNGPNLSTTKECSSFETEQLKALAMMKDNLPDCIVESFIEAGFDTLDVIAEIDTENTNSTLEEMKLNSSLQENLCRMFVFNVVSVSLATLSFCLAIEDIETPSTETWFCDNCT